VSQGNDTLAAGDQAVKGQGNAAEPSNTPAGADTLSDGTAPAGIDTGAEAAGLAAPQADAEAAQADGALDAALAAPSDASLQALAGPNEPTQLLDRLVDFMAVGGPVVWILSAFSVVALSIVLLKLWQFARLRPESSADVEQGLALWRQGETTAALAQLNVRRPVAELVELAMRGLSMHRDRELLREELTRLATQRLSQLRAWLRPLEVIATLSPLLGLLGTVLGMIVAFQQMEAAGSQVDPSVLSGGIWQALLTTAVGLAVAIPVMTLHNWLERKVERVAILMNDAVTQVFTGGLMVQAEEEQVKKVFEHAA